MPVGAAGASGVCAAGSVVTGFAPDGTLLCSLDAVGPAHAAGTGLTLDGATFSVQFGEISGTVTAGNDPRLPPERHEDGWLTFSDGRQWVALPPGNQAISCTRARPPPDRRTGARCSPRRSRPAARTTSGTAARVRRRRTRR